MGALRAAELADFGMTGVGRVFRYYRGGRIEDDDEVCVLHAVRELGFRPLTLSMVAIRRTLRRLVRGGVLTPAGERHVARRMKALHYPERTMTAFVAEMRAICGGETDARAETDAAGTIARAYSDPKVEDYAEMLDRMADRSARPPAEPPLPWSQIATRKWQAQFVDHAEEIPPLERW